jgi:hypothetical protein
MFLSLFFDYGIANTKKKAIIMELSLTLWPKWMLSNCLPPLLCSQIPLLDVMLNYGTSTMLKNGTLLFLVVWYLTYPNSRLGLGFLHPQPLISDKVLDLLRYS